ncbi:hypothetical protein GALMADRAFT_148185 [Galerina marginata CBS 339.88]|uniref:Uncharacterized protein n=1 Tax=Galerina marginata (strain CBS 339.88) TaxID=685588 RepID=A0A067S5E9_GALM3|nr:hypothetical protein GALMADRAFT_148185 [Galerina marginata CBS 339.88]
MSNDSTKAPSSDDELPDLVPHIDSDESDDPTPNEDSNPILSDIQDDDYDLLFTCFLNLILDPDNPLDLTPQQRERLLDCLERIGNMRPPNIID